MSLQVIYVTRHGFRSNWAVNPSTGDYTATVRSPTGIPADPALTAHGVEQARELAAHLLTLEPPVDQVYSSPYYRCLQTVEPFVKLKGQQEELKKPEPEFESVNPFRIRAEPGISEWYGSAPFEHPTSAAPEKLKQLFGPVFDDAYSSLLVPTKTGESIGELHHRVAVALGAIIDQCDREGFRAVLLCSHAATVIAMGRALTGKMPDNVETEDFRAFTCGLSVYRRREAQSAVKKQEHGGGSNEAPGWRTADLPNQMRDVSSSRSVGTREPERQSVQRRDSPSGRRPGTLDDGWRRSIGSVWDCEINCDCSFLSCGEERGWRFSGDESFLDQQDGSRVDAGLDLGVVVQGGSSRTTDRNPSAEKHRL